MAEIHVQTKKHNTAIPTWVWIVIALLIVGIVTWFVVKNKETTPVQTPSPASPTSQVQGPNIPVALAMLV